MLVPELDLQIYIIYEVLNLVTRKYYIGKTKRTLNRRWRGHVTEALSECDTMILHKSIRKYGEKNFQIRQIDTAYGLKHSKFLETFYILYYRSNERQYGYNTIIHDFEDIIDDKNFLEEISIKVHKNGKKYISMNQNGTYTANVMKNSKQYIKRSRDLNFLQEVVDKLNIALYDDYDDLYFPEKVEEYNKIDFKEYIEHFFDKTNKLIGVYWNKKRQTYHSRMNYKNMHLNLGTYKSSEEAAIIRDKVSYFLHGDYYTRFNFPDLIEKDKYIKEGKILFELSKLRNGQAINRKTTSKYIGVYKQDNSWRYSFQINKIIHKGSASTEIEAAKQRDILAIKYGGKILNFPVEMKSV